MSREYIDPYLLSILQALADSNPSDDPMVRAAAALNDFLKKNQTELKLSSLPTFKINKTKKDSDLQTPDNDLDNREALDGTEEEKENKTTCLDVIKREFEKFGYSFNIQNNIDLFYKGKGTFITGFFLKPGLKLASGFRDKVREKFATCHYAIPVPVLGTILNIKKPFHNSENRIQLAKKLAEITGKSELHLFGHYIVSPLDQKDSLVMVVTALPEVINLIEQKLSSEEVTVSQAKVLMFAAVEDFKQLPEQITVTNFEEALKKQKIKAVVTKVGEKFKIWYPANDGNKNKNAVEQILTERSMTIDRNMTLVIRHKRIMDGESQLETKGAITQNELIAYAPPNSVFALDKGELSSAILIAKKPVIENFKKFGSESYSFTDILVKVVRMVGDATQAAPTDKLKTLLIEASLLPQGYKLQATYVGQNSETRTIQIPKAFATEIKKYLDNLVTTYSLCLEGDIGKGIMTKAKAMGFKSSVDADYEGALKYLCTKGLISSLDTYTKDGKTYAILKKEDKVTVQRLAPQYFDLDEVHVLAIQASSGESDFIKGCASLGIAIDIVAWTSSMSWGKPKTIRIYSGVEAFLATFLHCRVITEHTHKFLTQELKDAGGSRVKYGENLYVCPRYTYVYKTICAQAKYDWVNVDLSSFGEEKACVYLKKAIQHFHSEVSGFAYSHTIIAPQPKAQPAQQQVHGYAQLALSMGTFSSSSASSSTYSYPSTLSTPSQEEERDSNYDI